MITAIRDDQEVALDILGNNYQYDQLQRIKQMKVYAASGLVANNNFTGAALYNGAGGESAYQENYSFDKNGNLLSLKRNGDNAASLAMDNFSYRYYTDRANTAGTIVTTPTLTNRLANVGDAVTSDPYTGDIANGQADDNYRYNQAGQLIMDKQEYIDNITWTPSGKVKRIYFTTAGQAAGKVDHKFIYDPMDRRVAKIEYQTAAPYTYIKYTYYTYDAGGNVMATYERTVQKNKSNNNYTDKLYLAEHVVYGADRIGAENSDALLSTYVFRMTEGSSLEGVYSSDNEVLTNETYEYSYRRVSDKHYEMSNHLGNVLVVVTDRKMKLTSTVYTADVVSYSDYSPYGTMLYNRHGQTEDYRYGYQGMEGDDNIKGEGNSYTTEFRQYDPRIGRWLTMDPLAAKYAGMTPYGAMNNNPMRYIDNTGLEGTDWIKIGHTYHWDSRVTDDASLEYYYEGHMAQRIYVGYTYNTKEGQVVLQANRHFTLNGNQLMTPDIGAAPKPTNTEPLDPFEIPKTNPNAEVIGGLWIDEGYHMQELEFWKRRRNTENLMNGLYKMIGGYAAVALTPMAVTELLAFATPTLSFLGSETTVVGSSGMLTTTTQFTSIVTGAGAGTGFIWMNFAKGVGSEFLSQTATQLTDASTYPNDPAKQFSWGRYDLIGLTTSGLVGGYGGGLSPQMIQGASTSIAGYSYDEGAIGAMFEKKSASWIILSTLNGTISPLWGAGPRHGLGSIPDEVLTGGGQTLIDKLE